MGGQRTPTAKARIAMPMPVQFFCLMTGDEEFFADGSGFGLLALELLLLRPSSTLLIRTLLASESPFGLLAGFLTILYNDNPINGRLKMIAAPWVTTTPAGVCAKKKLGVLVGRPAFSALADRSFVKNSNQNHHHFWPKNPSARILISTTSNIAQ
jgi:hypothetical protein